MFVLAGCGGSPLNPVEGTITYADGAPLTSGGLVIFTPMDAGIKSGARGVIKENGSYRMGTHGEADGVAVGQYRVAVVPPPLSNPNKPPPDWPPFDRKYISHEKSGLECTVVRGKNKYDIVVEK